VAVPPSDREVPELTLTTLPAGGHHAGVRQGVEKVDGQVGDGVSVGLATTLASGKGRSRGHRPRLRPAARHRTRWRRNLSGADRAVVEWCPADLRPTRGGVPDRRDGHRRRLNRQSRHRKDGMAAGAIRPSGASSTIADTAAPAVRSEGSLTRRSSSPR
jgi:hypothetical protein